MTKRHFLLLLFLGSLALRLYGIKLGLPSATGGLTTLHADESVTFYSLERMKPARLNFFPGDSLNWGTFYVYTVGATVKAMDLAGLVKLGDRAGLKKSLGEVDKMYLAARGISAIFGALSVLMIFFIGSLFMRERAAWLAAILMSVAQAPVMASYMVKTDSTMLFWALVAVYFSFRLLREPTTRNYCLTGAFFGLAVVTKYSALLLAFFPFAAHFYQAWREKDLRACGRKLGLALLSGAGVFALLNPFMLDSANWIYFSNMSKGSMGEAGRGTYFAYFASVLPAALGWAAALLSLAGVARWLRRGSAEMRLIAAYCVLYLLWAGGASDSYVLYSLLVLPLLILAAGDLADALLGSAWGRGLAAIVLLQAAAYTLCVKHFYVSDYTLAEADRWIASGIPAGSVVAVPKNDTWSPVSIRRHTGNFTVLEATASAVVQWDAVAALEKVYAKADYLVLAEQEFRPLEETPERFPAQAAALRRILAHADEVKRFSRRLPGWALPVDRADMGRHVLFMNPEIRIYKVRKG